MAQRIRLIVALIPIALMWWWLCTYAMLWRPDGWFSVDMAEGGGRRFYLADVQTGAQNRILFDWDAKTLTIVDMQSALAHPRRSTLPVVYFPMQELTYGYRTWQIDINDRTEGKVVRSLKTTILEDDHPGLVANRFLVVAESGALRWIDIDDEAPDWQTRTAVKGDSNWIENHPNQRLFWRIATQPTGATPLNGTVPQKFVELYRFDEQGKPNLLSSWPINPNMYLRFPCVKLCDDSLITLSPFQKQLEFHSLTDGSLVKTIDVDFQSDSPVNQYHFFGDQICVDLQQENQSKRHYFSIVTGQEESGPLSMGYHILISSPDGKRELWDSPDFKSTILTNVVTGETICRWQKRKARFVFLDDETLISCDGGWGLTIRQYDLTSGRTLFQWRPFRWVFWTLAPTLCLSTLWVWIWLRLPKPNLKWAWFDLLFVFAILMLLAITRLVSIGNPAYTLRLSYSFCAALSAGMLLAVSHELFFARSPLLPRITRLLCIMSVVLASAGWILHDKAQVAVHGFAVILIPSLISMPFFVVIAIRRCRRSIEPNMQPVTLQQMFWLTAAFALVFLSGSPFRSGLDGAIRGHNVNAATVVATLAGPLGLALAVGGQRARRVGDVIAFGCYAALAIPALYSCISGFWHPGQGENFLARSVTYGCGSYLATFVAMLTLMRAGNLVSQSENSTFADTA